jgi:hypothetical protein
VYPRFGDLCDEHMAECGLQPIDDLCIQCLAVLGYIDVCEDCLEEVGHLRGCEVVSGWTEKS